MSLSVVTLLGFSNVFNSSVPVTKIYNTCQNNILDENSFNNLSTYGQRSFLMVQHPLSRNTHGRRNYLIR